MIMDGNGTSPRRDAANEGCEARAGASKRPDGHLGDPPELSDALSVDGTGLVLPDTGGWISGVCEAPDTAADPIPPATDGRDEHRTCGGDPHAWPDRTHDFRVTASSYYGVGLDHPDFRQGETCYRCRDCGAAEVVLDSEMAALDAERWDG